jgi:outer membrane protein OmpA-like peptidoglycan-associated protein
LTHTARGLPPGAGGTPSFAAAPPVTSVLASAGDPVWVIQFGAKSAKLSTGDRREIARIAAAARDEGAPVRIVGHAGNGGETADDAEALRLSLDRAGAVANELTRAGVPADRVTATGVGAAEPAVIGGASSGAGNRRVEIFLDY